MEITRVGIVGGGLMGSGIAEVCGRAGIDTVVVEASADLADAASSRVGRSLAKAVERGKLDADDREATLSRIRFLTDLGGLADRELIIEAIVEDRGAKRDLFSRIDAVAPWASVLASNTSSIPIVDLATATSRPGRVVGLHFFNPVPVMRLVEVIPSLLTDATTVELVTGFAATTLGKTVVRAPDRAGFIVNALLIPYLTDAIRMLEAGHATREDIDAAMTLGAGYPMGPLALCDLIGTDTVAAVAESLYEEFGEPRLAPPALLRRMVAGGLLGRKTGHGFYEYE